MKKIFIKKADLAIQQPKPPQLPKEDPVEVVITAVRLPFEMVAWITFQVLVSIFLICLVLSVVVAVFMLLVVLVFS